MAGGLAREADGGLTGRVTFPAVTPYRTVKGRGIFGNGVYLSVTV